MGTQTDRAITQQVVHLLQPSVVFKNFCGQTSLEALLAIYQACSFLINFDNGAGHLAAAVGCPTITLFSNLPARIGKPLHPLTITVQNNTCEFREHCTDATMARCDKKCLYDISVEQVYQAVEKIINNIK